MTEEEFLIKWKGTLVEDLDSNQTNAFFKDAFAVQKEHERIVKSFMQDLYNDVLSMLLKEDC